MIQSIGPETFVVTALTISHVTGDDLALYGHNTMYSVSVDSLTWPTEWNVLLYKRDLLNTPALFYASAELTAE